MVKHMVEHMVKVTNEGGEGEGDGEGEGEGDG